MITLSIVSHGQGRLVAALLADLARLASPQVSAIVITRNVPEPPIVLPAALAAITSIVDNLAPLGFGANHNAAFARCASPLFAILNPDIRLGADPFDLIAQRFDLSRPLGAEVLVIASPRIESPAGHEQDAARQLITPWRLVARRVLARERQAVAAFDWLAGMFLVVRSDAFRTLQGFDARYFMYCEDFDLCARARLAGWRLEVVPAARVVHDAQRASHRSATHLAWHLSSLAKMWLSPVFWRYRRLLDARAARTA